MVIPVEVVIQVVIEEYEVPNRMIVVVMMNIVAMQGNFVAKLLYSQKD
jgi:hypothetical protein